MVKFTGRYAPADDSFIALVEANAVRSSPGREAGGCSGGGPEALLRVDVPGELSFAGAFAMRASRLRAALGGMDWGLQVWRESFCGVHSNSPLLAKERL